MSWLLGGGGLWGPRPPGVPEGEAKKERGRRKKKKRERKGKRRKKRRGKRGKINQHDEMGAIQMRDAPTDPTPIFFVA